MWGDCNLQLLHQVQEERMITLLHSLCWKLGVSSSRNSGFQEQIGCQIQEKIAWLSSRFEFCQFTGKDCSMIKTLWGGAWLWKRKGLVTCQMFPCIEAGWLQMTMVGISCWGTSWGWYVRGLEKYEYSSCAGIWLWRHEAIEACGSTHSR